MHGRFCNWHSSVSCTSHKCVEDGTFFTHVHIGKQTVGPVNNCGLHEQVPRHVPDSDSCLCDPKELWVTWCENDDKLVDELRLHRTGTQYTNSLAQHVPDDHEAITVRLVCRRTPREVGSGGRPRGDHWTHMKPKLPVKRKSGRCRSMPPKRKHGQELDSTQLASSGSIPTKVAPKSHGTARVWCARRCAIKWSSRSSLQHRLWKLYELYSVLRVKKTFFALNTLS